MKSINLALLLVLLSNNCNALSISAFKVSAGAVATSVCAYLTYITHKNFNIADKRFTQIYKQLEDMDVAIEESTTYGLNTARTIFTFNPRKPASFYNSDQRTFIRDLSQEIVFYANEKWFQAGSCAKMALGTILAGMLTCSFLEEFLKDLNDI